MKKLITAFVAVAIISVSAFAVQVDGYCFLAGRTNHDSTKVLFRADSPSARTDSTYTDSMGYYRIDVAVGVYDIYYTHDGYGGEEILDQACFSALTLSDITLYVHLSGNLSGTLEGIPYLVSNNIYVSENDSLNIEPGAIFFFNGEFQFYIGSFSCLRAIGTETDSIKFLPYIGVPNWRGIGFAGNASDSCKMEYCLITGSNNGGINIGNYSSICISHCTISRNSKILQDGGGIYIGQYSNTIISFCVIEFNSVYGRGGGIFCAGNSNPNINNCVIIENSSGGGGGGGGIYCSSSSATISHCIISGNSATYDGGGFRCSGTTSPTIINCNIIDNSAENGSGIHILLSSPYINNVIVKNNAGRNGIYFDTSPNTSITFSDFHNNQGGNFAGNSIPQWLGQILTVNNNGDSCDTYMNIFLDPLFVDSSDFHIQSNSPCIDAGDPTSPLDPDSTIADIGAFYYDHTPPQPMPEITLSVDNLNFPATITGRYRRLPFNIRNTGNADLILYGMTFSLPAVFSHNWNSADSILAPGNNISIEVTFSPQDSINYSDSLTIANNDSAINVYLSGVGVNPVTISLAPVNPPIVISPNGGWFRFDAAAVNSSSALMRFDFWTVVTLPGVGSAQLMNHRNAPLDPGSRTVNFRQGVPAYAPGGTYIYYAYSGIFPWVVDDCDSFTFEKLGADGGSLGSPQDWPCDGWFFDDEESVSLHHSSFSIHNSYPNPFNAATAITFHLPAASNVKLAVYDIGGREIVNLASGFHPAGVYEVVFDGSQLSSGVYFARLEAGGFTQIRKLLLIK